VRENPAFASVFKLRLIGKVDFSVKQSIRDSDLEGHVEYVDYMPHADVPVQLGSATLLLLVLNDTPNAKGILTGKMFEYLASGRTILCIGPVDGDAAQILTETGAGMTCGFGDYDAIRKALLDQFTNYQNGLVSSLAGDRRKYSRKSLTGDLVRELNSIVKTD
jgi:hypothetical protein